MSLSSTPAAVTTQTGSAPIQVRPGVTHSSTPNASVSLSGADQTVTVNPN